MPSMHLTADTYVVEAPSGVRLVMIATMARSPVIARARIMSAPSVGCTTTNNVSLMSLTKQAYNLPSLPLHSTKDHLLTLTKVCQLSNVRRNGSCQFVVLKTNLTKHAFNRVFNEFVLTYGEHKNTRLLFYYAGHGHTRPMATHW